MPTLPVFQQVSAAPSLYAMSPAPATGWAGFWTAGGAAGATITLAQAWANGAGVYLFASEAPTSLPDFATGTAALLARRAGAGVRVLWIASPNPGPAGWRTQYLLAKPDTGGAWSVTMQAMLPVGSYALMIPAGTSVSPSAGGDGLVLGGAAMLVCPRGVFPVSPAGCIIPLTDAGIGTVQAVLPIAGDAPGDAFARLGVALRYAYPSPDKPGATEALSMPILGQNGQSFSLQFGLFPRVPENPALTSFTFVSGASGYPLLSGYLRTPEGYGTTLTPMAAMGALPAARLVFGWSPRWPPVDAGAAPALEYHLCPDGAFTLATLTPAAALHGGPDGTVDRVLLGASGMEYGGLTAQAGCIALFAGGQPAYAPSPGANAGHDAPLLTGDGATAYATVLPPGGTGTALAYFAQPRAAPLFQASSDNFLDYLELPAAELPLATASLPVGVFAGVAPERAKAARRLEAAVLAPARRLAVRALSAELVDGTPVTGTTPQGLVATVSSDFNAWQSVVVANMPRMKPAQRAFTSVGADLQAALQADQLFCVIADPTKISTDSGSAPLPPRFTSVAYRLDARMLSLLQAQGVAPATVDALRQGLAPAYPTFATKPDFLTRVRQLAPAVTAPDLAAIFAIAGQLSIVIDGWSFQVSPDSWRTGDDPTTLLVKFGTRTLEELLRDRAGWGFPGAAGADPAATQARLQAIVAQAKAAYDAGRKDAYAQFYGSVAANPAWNGFLFFDAPVSIADLPDDLRFLAAGIDASRFYAHHLAIGATSIVSSTGAIALGQTSIAGLIDYEDPADLVLGADVHYAFKTLRLTARFANTALVDFQAQAELMVNRLFGATTTKREPVHGNNLLLDGGFQRQNGQAVYSFVLEGANDYVLARSALLQTSVSRVRIQTLASNDSDTTVAVSFLLAGALRFVEFADFDLFSYGEPLVLVEPPPPDVDSALAYDNLGVSMTFDLGAPGDKHFAFIPDNLAFDPRNSAPRDGALSKRFPVRLSAFVRGGDEGATGSTPEDLGYGGVLAPFDAVPMTAPWYGLVFKLDLGTLGALTGGKPLAMSLLAAWCPGGHDDDRPAYLGLKMPNARPLGADWPLQGVLRLGFRSLDFVASGPRASRDYMLRMRRFSLSALGMHFPPGNLDVFLFGGAASSPVDRLAWYAAYVPSGDAKAPPPVYAPSLTDAQRTVQPARLTRPERAARNGRRGRPPHRGM